MPVIVSHAVKLEERRSALGQLACYPLEQLCRKLPQTKLMVSEVRIDQLGLQLVLEPQAWGFELCHLLLALWFCSRRPKATTHISSGNCAHQVRSRSHTGRLAASVLLFGCCYCSLLQFAHTHPIAL